MRTEVDLNDEDIIDFGCDCSSDEDKTQNSSNSTESVEREVDFELMDDDAIGAIKFLSVDDAHKFYIEYDRFRRFDVQITHTKSIVKDGVNIDMNREIECVKAGKPSEDGNQQERQTKEETRSDCQSFFRVARRGELLIVTAFVSSHNHELETPETMHRLKCNRHISAPNKVILNLFNEAGFRTCQILDYLERIHVGKLPFKRKVGYNLINKDRQELVGNGDAHSALHLLEGMKLVDPGMYFKHKTEEDNSLSMLFWIDGFSREAYRLFGDVLVFDSTYKTNIYQFPLVILSGVDNHLRNCVFGAALMFNEMIESYRWLLKTFLKAMGGHAPVSVLTDQYAAMAAAIKAELPKETKHRLCCWHLQKNCIQRVKRPGFCGDFGRLLKENLSVEE